MTTGNFADWSGNMLDLGPLYPFVGWEEFMVLLAVVFWVGWHVMQIRAENVQLDEETASLNQGDNLKKAVEAERIVSRL